MGGTNNILKISDWIYLFIKNIKMYVRLTTIIWFLPLQNNSKRRHLLSFLCKRTYNYPNYPKPIMFFFTNIILSIIIRITENTSGVLEQSISLDNIFSTVGGITVGSIVSLIEYIAGAIIFSLLVKYLMFKITNTVTKANIIFNYVCYASAYFIPMLFLQRLYIDLGISWIEYAMVLYYFHTVTYFLDAQTILVVLLIIITQLLWINFVADGISCITKRIKIYACVFISFIVTSCTLPTIFTTYEIIAKQRIINNFKEIEEAKLNRNADKILKNTLLLIKNKRLSPMVRYHRLLEYAATFAYIIAPTDYAQIVFELICDNNYSALEGKFNEAFDNKNNAWHYMMPQEAQGIFNEVKTSEPFDKEQIFLSRHRYDVLDNLLLTPLNPSRLFKQFEDYPIFNDLDSKIKSVLIQNDESLIQEFYKLQNDINRTREEINNLRDRINNLKEGEENP